MSGSSAAEIAIKVREIVEESPEIARCGLGKVFLERIERFAETLAIWGVKTNLTAHPGDASEVAFHVIDSIAPLHVGPSTAFLPGRDRVRVLDLGSGAGFPGLILAAAVEGNFVLAEARRKRASFLSVAATEMGLGHVAVESSRMSAESVAKGFDVVTSRAVGEAGFEVAAAALKVGGLAMFWVNHGQVVDIGRARGGGLEPEGRFDYGVRRGQNDVRRELIVFARR